MVLVKKGNLLPILEVGSEFEVPIGEVAHQMPESRGWKSEVLSQIDLESRFQFCRTRRYSEGTLPQDPEYSTSISHDNRLCRRRLRTSGPKALGKSAVIQRGSQRPRLGLPKVADAQVSKQNKTDTTMFVFWFQIEDEPLY